MTLLDRLLRTLLRLRRPERLTDALAQDISPQLVRACPDQSDPAALLSFLAAQTGTSIDDILTHAGARLNLSVRRSLSLPTPAVLQAVQHDPQILRAQGILPQPDLHSPLRYCLVVADPALVARDDYARISVPIFLGDPFEISRTWHRYEQTLTSVKAQPELTPTDVQRALLRLVRDARSLGATQAYLGLPQANTYQFFIGDNRYSGKFSTQYIEFARQYYAGTHRIRVQDEELGLPPLLLEVNTDAEDSSIELSWCDLQQQSLEGNSSIDRNALGASGRDKNLPVSFGDAPLDILLLDDDPIFRKLLTNVLTSKSWKVDGRADARAALRDLEKRVLRPSLIICDVHMPLMDGPTFVRSFREYDQKTPILMLTSDDDQEIEMELALHGVDSFLRKDENPRLLVAWCSNLLQRSTRLAQPDDAFQSLAMPNGGVATTT